MKGDAHRTFENGVDIAPLLQRVVLDPTKDTSAQPLLAISVCVHCRMPSAVPCQLQYHGAWR